MNYAIYTQLLREIDEINNYDYFKMFHQKHAFDRHYKTTHRSLKKRMEKTTLKPYEIVSYSRYQMEFKEQDICHIIFETLLHNIQEIKKWFDSGSDMRKEISYEFPTPIGEGIVAGTDLERLFPMSKNTVAVCRHKNADRLFCVISSYPTFGLDEVDQVWDAIDGI